MRSLILAAALVLSAPALAQTAAPPPSPTAAAILATAPPGTRFGLLVVDADGHEVISIRADERFIPASNTKLFTTAAAFALLTDKTLALTDHATSLSLTKPRAGKSELHIRGSGVDISTASDCAHNCLKPMAFAIAQQTRKIGRIVVDDSRFTDQRWSPGMSWNNIGTDSGTAVSALVIDANELPIVVTPGAAGQQPAVTVSPYLTLINDAVTVAEGGAKLVIDWGVNGRTVRIAGTIGAAAPPWRDRLGLDDPADYFAWAVSRELQAQGVKVQGKVRLIRRPVGTKPAAEAGSAQPYTFSVIAVPPTIADEARLINKVSQNLHAEVLIRRLGQVVSNEIDAGLDESLQPDLPVDSLERGLAVARGVFGRAGIPRAGYDFSDGSGMSTYNRMSPRAAVTLLRWSAIQPWGNDYRASMPIGGIDGTLRRRFAGTPLEGKVWAKTGTLNATNALSGWLKAASGRELTFSIIANDVPDGSNAVPVMDQALLAIAAAN